MSRSVYHDCDEVGIDAVATRTHRNNSCIVSVELDLASVVGVIQFPLEHRQRQVGPWCLA